MTNKGEQERWMFTKADRETLRTTEEEWQKTEGALYKRRQKVRERLLNGITEFTIAQRELSKWNWPKFVDLAKENESDVRQGMESAIALFYELHQANGWNFERTLWSALEEAYTHGQQRDMPNRAVENVSFESEIRERLSAKEMKDRIERKIEADEMLTDREKAWAVETSPELLKKVHQHAKRDSYRRRQERKVRKYTDE